MVSSCYRRFQASVSRHRSNFAHVSPRIAMKLRSWEEFIRQCGIEAPVSRLGLGRPQANRYGFSKHLSDP